MNARDVIHALRLWLPEGKSVAAVREELAETIQAAFAEFSAASPGSAIADPSEILPPAATAAGRGLLQEAVDAAKDDPADHLLAEPLKETLAQLNWQGLLLAAACAAGDDAANRTLLALIQSQVRPSLVRKWGRDRGEELADDLPQKLHLSDQRGLNRGRIRLLAYGGRSSLVTWLRAVGHQAAIDCWRGEQRRSPATEPPEAVPQPGDEPGGQLVAGEELDMIRRVGRLAFEQLMRELPQVSEQQYRFAYFRCIGRLDNNAIAARLGVGKSRVTELSQQVFRRLIAILRRLAPELAEISDEASKERRRKVEEALQEWFGQEAAAEEPEDRASPASGKASQPLRGVGG